MTEKDQTNNVSDTNEFEVLKARCEEYLAGWKRAQADYANLLREVEKDKLGLTKFANESLLEKLLPAIDQFENALFYSPDPSRLPEEEKQKYTSWLAGMQAVRALWENVFREIGLSKIETNGDFDPLWHEAVSHEASELPPGTIVRVVQPGWQLNGKLLRPARVIVSTSLDTIKN